MLIASAFRFALRLISIASVVSISPGLFAQAQSLSAADGFDPNVDGNVYALVVQPDGKILIGGEFTELRPNGVTTAVAKANIARLLPDGRVDTSFGAFTNERVSSIALQADGQIVIGGHFTAVNGQTRNRAARLTATGALDPTFDPNATGGFTPEVNAVVIDPRGGIVIGGGFTTVQPNGAAAATTRNRIARFHADGSLDTTFDPNPNAVVLALAAQADGKILLGGGFTSLQPNGAGTATERHRIARVNTDGTLDTSFDPKANNAVSAIAVQPDGNIIIGGTFTTIQPPGASEAITVNRLCRLTPAGLRDDTFFGQANGQVYSIHVEPTGGVLVGGSFSSLGGSAQSYAGRLLPNGRLDFGFVFGPNFNVYAFGVQSDGSVVMGGGFTSLRGNGIAATPRNHVARVSVAGGLDTDFRPDINGRVRTIVRQSDGKILAGGTFTSMGGATHDSLVRLESNGAVDPSFNANITGTVLVVTPLSSGKILVGGTFSHVNGEPRTNLVRLNDDGSIDYSMFNVVIGGTVNAIVEQADGKVLVGGAFNSVWQTPGDPALSVSRIVRLNTDGSIDRAFGAGVNEVVNTIALQSDGKILVGGGFSIAAGTGATSTSNRPRIVRFDANGAVDATFTVGLNGTVNRIVVQPDQKIIVAGSFTQAAGSSDATGTARNNIARFSAAGALDTAFDPNVNGQITTLAVQDDKKILIGGFFISVGTGESLEEINYVARLEESGALDESFDLNLPITPGHEIVSFAFPENDGTQSGILLAGAFNLQGADMLLRIAQLTLAGTLDPSFNAHANSVTGAQITAISTQTTGRIFVGGSFSNISGTTSTNLARFDPDGSPDASFTPALNGPVYSIAELPSLGDPIPVQASSFAWLESNGQLREISLPANIGLSLTTAIAVQSDGKVLFAGDVTLDGTNRFGVLRLNENGSLDTSFQLKTVPGVRAIALQTDGKIVLGGDFDISTDSDSNTIEHANLVRLNTDGTIDTGFKQNVNGAVSALVVEADGQIVAGGDFTSAMNTPTGTATTGRSRLARFNGDGALDTNFNPTVNGPVHRLFLESDGKMLVSGEFTSLQPNGAATATTRNAFARLNADGTLDSLDLNPNGLILSIVRAESGHYYVGGSFTQIAGKTRAFLTRFSESFVLDETFYPNPNAPVVSIAPQGDKILIGGAFTALMPNTPIFDPTLAIPRNGAARLNFDGTVDGAFNPNFNANVTRLVVHPNGSLLVNGSFTNIQPNGSLVIGGSFTAMNGIAVTNLALLSDDGSTSASFRPEPNGAVHAVLPLPSGAFLVGGAFTEVNEDVTRNGLALFNADNSLNSNFNPNVSGVVYALAVQNDGKFVIGGDFTAIGGTSRENLARLNTDGTVDTSFSPSAPGPVRAIALQRDGRILYTTEAAGAANTLLRVNANGSADATFTATHNNAVTSIAVQTDGNIYVGGTFTTIAGENRPYFAALTQTGALATAITPADGSGPNGPVNAITFQADGKIVIAGSFSKVGNLGRFGLARLAAPTPVAQSFLVNSSGSTVTWYRTSGAPEAYAVLFERSTDGVTWTSLGQGTRIGSSSDWRLTGLNIPAGVNNLLRARALALSSPNTSISQTESRAVFYRSSSTAPTGSPTITSATVVNGRTSSNFIYGIGATQEPTSYTATGLPAGLTINTTNGLISGTPTQTGTFTINISATNSFGTTTVPITLIVTAGGAGGASQWHLLNIACLADVTSTRPLIMGFVVSGSGKSVLLRGVGPGLTAHGVTGVLQQPRLTLSSTTRAMLQNTRWGGGTDLANLFTRLGEFPLDPESFDAATAVTLDAGAYTVVLDPAAANASGKVLAEVYDADGNESSQQFSAMAARGYVSANGMLTGGFVLTGDTPRQVLIRGVGPALTKTGVTDPLVDPVVKVFNNSGQVIAENNDWETPVSGGTTGAAIAAAAAATGPMALDAGSKDAAVLVTLQPGIYTAQVTGSPTTAGTVLIEIYEVP